MEVTVIRREFSFKLYSLMLQTDVHKEHEDADIDGTEIREPERRDDAVLAGSSVTVYLKRSVTFINDLPRLDIACSGSKSDVFRNTLHHGSFPELFYGDTDK